MHENDVERLRRLLARYEKRERQRWIWLALTQILGAVGAVPKIVDFISNLSGQL